MQTRHQQSVVSTTHYLIATIVAGITVLPISYLLWRAFSDGLEAVFNTLWRPRTLELFINTGWLIFTVAAAATILGVATAWIITNLTISGKRLWVTLAALPLAVPSFVASYAWLSSFPTAFGFWPLALVLTLCGTPFVTVPTIAAFAKADYAPAEVALTLGQSRLRIFRTLILPQILPATSAGALIVVLYVLSDFGAPSMMRYETLTVGVYSQLIGGAGHARAASLALILTLTAGLIVYAEQKLRAFNNQTATSSYRYQQKTPVWANALGIVFLTTVFLTSVVAPLAALLHTFFNNQRYETDWGRIGEAALSTLLLGVIAATIATVAGLSLAYLTARVKTRYSAILETATFVGNSLPGVVLALAMVTLTLRLMPSIYQTTLSLLIAYVILFIPKSVGSARASFAQLPVQVEETAQTLGDAKLAVWFKLCLPNAWPGIAAGWLLVMTSVMKELPATLMLRPTGTVTLATELWNASSINAYGAAAPIGVVLVALGIVPTLLLAASVKKALPTELTSRSEPPVRTNEKYLVKRSGNARN
ncbi:iron ABC transporter permease [Gleimia sp. 6138-11-ORH1]|uniref:ABC transporter permease n=1 Tax=Gleimia sp. 6138-11-ORH1 TaxID=2973937 RepID=UPI002167161B|nr:iron ABC transporter permease [Gleimia sp. 6138-11-ORH1]MCS4484580.1 iron ABC transporter permease [Gleimia sp. 6138-11-ORH1]